MGESERLSEADDMPVTIMDGLDGDDALADLHAKYHCEDGNMLGADDCGWEGCHFWEIAAFVAPAYLARLAAVPDPSETGVAAPDCPDHREVQHRDRKPPWCNQCGWNRGRPAIPARQVGKPRAVLDEQGQP